MKIIHELNQLEYGGVERVIRNIIKYDTENEHTVIAYKDGAFKAEFDRIGAKVIIPDGVNELDFEADIIHIHSGGDLSNMAMGLGERFPVIETIHSPIRSPLPQKVIRQRVGVTEYVSQINGGITIYNGIDFEDINLTKVPAEIREELGIPDGKIVVGRLGRVARDKCLEEWLLACYELQQQGYDFVPLIVGGEHEEGYIGKLKLMAESLPVKNVIWVGHKTDIANYLAVMDTFLYPSPTEGFGLVFIEAMYVNPVVVTYNTDITQEILGGHAILTEKSIQGLVDGVKKSFKQELRDEIQGIAREFVMTEYSAEKMSLEYQKLYKEVVG